MIKTGMELITMIDEYYNLERILKMAAPYTASTPSDPDDVQLPLPIHHNNYPSLPPDWMIHGNGTISPLPTGQCPIVEHPEHNSFATEYKTVYTEECTHIPINVGFNRAKFVCKKCDKVLEE